jgi:hypothetical protein
MNWYLVVLVIHVITAVGALGQLGVLGLMTRLPNTANPEIMSRILRAAGSGLVIMLLSGIGLLWLSDWMFMHTWWLRIAVLLTIAMGAMHGIASATLRKGTSGGKISTEALAKLKGLAIGMSATLALIVLLMEAKPF